MTLGLDLTNVAENGGTIPAGRYTCVVEDAKVVATKSGTGEMVKVQLKVCDQGAYFGRNLFDQFNIRNSNPQAVTIGLSQLKGLMKAGGHKNINRLESASELVGLKVVAVTKVESDPQYGENTRVKNYAPVGGVTTSPAAAAGAKAANPFA